MDLECKPPHQWIGAGGAFGSKKNENEVFALTPIYIMMKKIKAEEKQIRRPISNSLVICKLVWG